MNNTTDKWGFRPEHSQTIDLDTAPIDLYRKTIQKVPGLRACFFCGSCSSTCSVSNDGMSFRQVNLLLQRGEIQKLKEKIAPCILCGKCTLVCPRNVDTRAVIYHLRILLYEHK